MEKIIILGHCNAVLAGLLDIIYNNDKFTKIDIISNINESYDNDTIYNIDELLVNEYTNDEYKNNIYGGCVLGVNSPKSKNQVYDFFLKNKNISINHYQNLMAKDVNLPHTVIIGKGCTFNYASTIGPYSKIGNFVTINRNSSIGHHSNIGDFVTISPGVNMAGTCNVGANTIIGIGATIVNNINIGSNVVIGAGSVVTKDIPSNTVYYGVPAKFIRINE